MTTIKNLLMGEAKKPGGKAEHHLKVARQFWAQAKETYPHPSAKDFERQAKEHAQKAIDYEKLGEESSLDDLELGFLELEEADLATQIKFHTNQMHAAAKAYNAGKGSHHYAIHQFHKKKLEGLGVQHAAKSEKKPGASGFHGQQMKQAASAYNAGKGPHHFQIYKHHELASAGQHGVGESVEMNESEYMSHAEHFWKTGRKIADNISDKLHASSLSRKGGPHYQGSMGYHLDKAEHHEAMMHGHGRARDHYEFSGDKKKAATHERVRASHERMLRHHDKMAAMMESVNESTPPGMEDQAKSMKPSFKKRYGKRWANVLYATLWKRYNESVEVNLNGELGSTYMAPGRRTTIQATPPNVEVNLNGELGSRYMQPGKRVQVPSNPSTVAVNLNGEIGGHGPEPGRYNIPPVGEADIEAMLGGKRPNFYDFVAGFRDPNGSYNTQRTAYHLNLDSGNTSEYP